MKNSFLWAFTMAWRERRRGLRSLALLTLTAFTGIASLVISLSVSRAFETAIYGQSKSLVGADIRLSLKDPFPDHVKSLLSHSGAEIAHEVQFRSMVRLAKKSGAENPIPRLAQVRGISGDFPFYGEFSSTPENAWVDLRASKGPGVIVDEALLLQMEGEVGDTLTVGGTTLEIKASLQRSPGDAPIGYLFAPRVIVPLEGIPSNFLQQKGALADYHYYLRFAIEDEARQFLKESKEILDAARVEVTTVETRREVFGRVNENLGVFFDLFALIALSLGALGIISGLSAFLAQREKEIGILKCLGATTRDIQLLLLVQVLTAAAGAVILGLLAGGAISSFLLREADKIVRLGLSTNGTSPSLFFIGTILGFGVVGLIAFPTLRRFSKISPFTVFRPFSDQTGKLPLVSALGTICLLFLSFALLWQRSLLFAAVALGALFLVGGSFVLIGKWLMRLSSWIGTRSSSYILRQGILRVGRPGNRTVLFVFAVGISTFLLSTVLATQHLLGDQIDFARGDSVSNIFMFDIQPDQEEGVRQVLQDLSLSVDEEVPIVLMKIKSLHGKPVESFLSGRDSQVPAWTLRRDYWTSYRSRQIDNEKIVEGEWIPRVEPGTEVIPVSIEDRLAQRLGVTVGSEITWDVQGIELKTRVASLRDIIWERMRRNAFVIFPEGVLEEAPRFLFYTTTTKGSSEMAKLQSEISQKFPNVTIVDLRSVVDTIDAILRKMGEAVLLLSILVSSTGLFIILSLVLSGAGHRRDEGVIYRTLGAARAQVLGMLLAEHLFMSLLAGLTAVVLSIATSWVLAKYAFHVNFSLSAIPLLLLVFGIVALVLSIVLFGNRRMVSEPCLEVLRKE